VLPGAPACVVKAAHRYLIELHHPDRGGSERKAKAVNVARDEVADETTPANEYVAQNYTGEPWHVLGLMANADRALVDRAARALSRELRANRRLVERIEWATRNFGTPGNGARPAPTPPPPPKRASAPRPKPRHAPATAGKPEGLVDRIDLGTLAWGSTVKTEIRLTWREFAPYKIRVEAPSPIVADVIESKALPGRFIVALSVDWVAVERDRQNSARGLSIDAGVTVRWPGDGEATVRVRGVLHYPATVFASPTKLDLGTVTIDQRTDTTFALVSNAATTVGVQLPAWLRRVDGSGNVIESAIQLTANTPYRVALRVDWAPIRERGAASIRAGKPVRPTGTIVVRWESSDLALPAEMVVAASPGTIRSS
jgi:hypothetical protein